MPGVISLRRWLAAAALTLALFAPAAIAADPPQPKVLRLEPKKMDGVERGKAVVVKGKAGPEGHRFLVDQLSYMMPVAVALRPVEEGDEVALAITKYAWNQPLRQGTTDGDFLRYVFRTEGEFQLAVSAKEAGTPYRLLVWVGEETKPDFAPVVVKASEFQGAGKSEGGGSPVLWVIAAALIAVVALLVVVVLRRKSS